MYEASTLQARFSRIRASKISASVGDRQRFCIYHPLRQCFVCKSRTTCDTANEFRKLPKTLRCFSLAFSVNDFQFVSFQVPFNWNVLQICPAFLFCGPVNISVVFHFCFVQILLQFYGESINIYFSLV